MAEDDSLESVASATLGAAVILEELITQGVREVVLAPGSRSAPLAYQAYDADRRGDIRLHVRIDERSAAFLALGLAKASGRPVPVITTSGTAVANLHPAVLEASHSGVPLVIISADRPMTMINTGANQTTDQARLFEKHVRAQAQLDADSRAIASWRFQVARVVTAALGTRTHHPGPVQLNVAFGEPLTPTAIPELRRRTTRVDPLPIRRDPVPLPIGPPTVIIAGDAPVEVGQAACAAAAEGSIPLLAEPSSNARGAAEAIGAYRLLLASSLADEIERVIVYGNPTLSRPVQALLRRPGIELIMVSDRADWVDPATNATRVVSAIQPAAQSTEWLDRWRRADAAAQMAIEQTERSCLSPSLMLTGQQVAALVWQSLQSKDLLFVGSSNPVRDLDLVPIRSQTPVVYANRGLAGIDGSVSTALGIALAAGRPAHALLGDLTFLHDSNGLIIGPAEPRPDLRIIVANDDGGSIFSTLEQGEQSDTAAFERVFATPHRTSLRALVEAVGVDFVQVRTADELSAILFSAPRGIQVVEAVIDRGGRRARALAVEQAVVQALIELGP